MVDPALPSSRRMTTLVVNRVQIFLVPGPLEVPVETSFGRLTSRPSLLVRVEERSGAAGWGEVWCNHPETGAEYRARILTQYVAPLMIGQRYVKSNDDTRHSKPKRTCSRCRPATRARSRTPSPASTSRCGTCGPAERVRVVAAARRHRVAPGADVCERDRAGEGARRDRRSARCRLPGVQGERRRGFQRDLRALAGVRASFDYDLPLMENVNQAWDIAEAMRLIRHVRRLATRLARRADCSRLSGRTVGGESRPRQHPDRGRRELRGTDAFDVLIGSRAFGVAQPDLTKWGGFTGAFVVGRRIKAAKLKFAPHASGAAMGSLHRCTWRSDSTPTDASSSTSPRTRCGPRVRARFPALRDGTRSLPNGPGLVGRPRPGGARTVSRRASRRRRLTRLRRRCGGRRDFRRGGFGRGAGGRRPRRAAVGARHAPVATSSPTIT